MGVLRTATTVASSTTGAGLAYKTAGASRSLEFGDGVEGPPISSPVITAANADAIAAYLANTSDGTTPLVTIRLDGDSEPRMITIRDLDLNQRVIATESVTGATLDGFVEQITHRITDGGLRHECEIRVSARTRMAGVYSPDPPADPYDLSTYSADAPAEPPPFATYGF